MASPLTGLPALLRAGPAHDLGWSALADPLSAGLMARAGFDAVLLDQQHGRHDFASSLAGLTELALAGTPGIVRAPVGGFAMASRMLDAGAVGIVAPMINTVEDARALVAHTKYPPLGQRSWAPDRALQLLGMSGPDYLAGANALSLTLAMCETAEAIAALDAILAVPGIDGILVGPADLSIALARGSAIDPLGAAVTAALNEIVGRTRNADKIACAFAHAPERAAEMAGMGFQLVSVQCDTMIMDDAFRQALRTAGAA